MRSVAGDFGSCPGGFAACVFHGHARSAQKHARAPGDKPLACQACALFWTLGSRLSAEKVMGPSMMSTPLARLFTSTTAIDSHHDRASRTHGKDVYALHPRTNTTTNIQHPDRNKTT